MTDTVPPRSPTSAWLPRRLAGRYTVDPWGLDRDLLHAAARLADLRWRIDVRTPDGIPADGPALVVFNRRFGLSEAPVVVAGVLRATGRVVRVLGAPDWAPVGTVARRLGFVVRRPQEVAGLLRAGEVVALPLDHQRRVRQRAGRLDAADLEAAVVASAPVVPIAVVGREAGWRWVVSVGKAVPPPAGSGPLAVAEFGDAVQAAVQTLIDDATQRPYHLAGIY